MPAHAGKACWLEGPPGSQGHALHPGSMPRSQGKRPQDPFSRVAGSAPSSLQGTVLREERRLSSSLGQGPWLRPCQLLARSMALWPWT